MALEARSDLFGERLNNSRHLWTSQKGFHLGLSAGCWRAIA